MYVINTVPKENLLVWNLKDGWEPLCKFLGKPIPGYNLYFAPQYENDTVPPIDDINMKLFQMDPFHMITRLEIQIL